MSALVVICLLCAAGFVGVAVGISLGASRERRSAHEAWGAPRKPRNDSQYIVVEGIRDELRGFYSEFPRPIGVVRAGRSRVSVDREGAVTRMQLSDFGRFAGEAE